MNSLKFLISSALLVFMSSAHANITCDVAAIDANPAVGAIGDFREPIYKPTGPTKGTLNTRSLNQCRASECYLFAFLGAVEVQNQNQRGDADAPAFSGGYLFAKKLLSFAGDQIWYGPDKTFYSLKGGNLPEAMNLARQHGLMPEESWRPKVPFESWDFARLYEALDKKGKEWNVYVASLARKHGWKSAVVKNAYEQGRADLQSVVLSLTGPLPTEIDFRNQTLTTKDIERKYGIDHRATIYMMYPTGKFRDNKEKLNQRLDAVTTPFGGSYAYTNANWQTIEKTMVEWINSKAPVIVDLDWNKTDAHSMVVVDYESENGLLKRWKVKNSWGDNFSDEGYAWYTYQDMRDHLFRTWRFGYTQKK